MALTRAVTRANRIPIKAEPRNMTRKFPMEPKIKAATDMSGSPWFFRAFSTVLYGRQQQGESGTCNTQADSTDSREEVDGLLCHDNGHSVIQHTLPKDQHVKSGVHIQSVEDGQSSNWVHGRDKAPKGKTGERRGVHIMIHHTTSIPRMCVHPPMDTYIQTVLVKVESASN